MPTIREEGFSRGGFGLNRSRIWQYVIDNVSNPDGWQFGFEIVYRLGFYFHENGQKDHLRDIAEFRKFLSTPLTSRLSTTNSILLGPLARLTVPPTGGCIGTKGRWT